ncbi:DUF3592 domain-containing protein [Streptomyces sp. NPDC007172]|uniref:DUF3592 domain-containing protein n=1 Tax=Streptomyces sp. NPDC007172 TaxID=3364776 RepID=UPI00369794B0
MYIFVILSGVLLIPLILFLFVDIIPLWRSKKLVANGVRVKGECVMATWSSDAGTLRVKYVTQGGVELEHCTDLLDAPSAETGDLIDILHDRRKPSRSMVAGRAERMAARRLLSGPFFYLELFFLIPQGFWIYLLGSGAIHS